MKLNQTVNRDVQGEKMTSRTKILKNDVCCNVQTFAFVDKESDRFHSVVALFVLTYITSP